MQKVECKKVSKVMAQVDGELTGTCLGVWNRYDDALKHASKSNALIEKSHPWLEYVVVDTVVLLDTKAM